MSNEAEETVGEDALAVLFPEPQGYYKPPAPPSTVSFRRKNQLAKFILPLRSANYFSPSTLTLRLVGQHSLWGHHLWNAARVLANYFDSNPALVCGRKLLELGAGGALPSFIGACNMAQKVCGSIYSTDSLVVITDYPDIELIENIRYNVANCGIDKTTQERIAVEGYLWGSDPDALLAHIDNESKFDVIILSDTVTFYPISLLNSHFYRYLIILNIVPLSNLFSSI